MKRTKTKLVSSIVTLLVCFAMLVGSTFAWFTDSASTGVNTIQAGNLDIEVSYKHGNDWASIQNATSLFSNNLWEPGHTEYVTLKIENKGTLALKYKILVTPVSESGGINIDNQPFKLSDSLVFGTKKTDSVPTLTRDTARTFADNVINFNNANTLAQEYEMEKGAAPQYITLVVYMPETVGNAANYKTGTAATTIDLGIKVVATQLANENDSFGSDYDAGAIEEPFYAGVGAYYDYFEAVNETSNAREDGSFTITKTDSNTGIIASVSGTATAGSKVNMIVMKSSDAEKNFSINVQDGYELNGYEIKVTGQNEGSLVYGQLYVGTGLENFKFYHNGSEMQQGTQGSLTDREYHYNENDGYVYFATTSFSPFQATYKAPVAAIGTAVYGTLADAFDAVTNGSNTTITLLKDAIGGGVKVVNGRNINVTFDLAGHTYTCADPAVGSAGTETQGFHLEKGNSFVFKNGTLKVANTVTGTKMLFQVYSDLTLENMNIDGSNLVGDAIVLSVNCGNVNVIGNTSVTSKSGGYAVDASWWPTFYPEGAKVTVNTSGTINGDMSLGAYGNNGSITTPSNTKLIIDNVNNYGEIVKVDGASWGERYSTGLSDEQLAELFADMCEITGGTFNNNPSNYVVDGYSAILEGNVYKVINGVLVYDEESINNALNSGYNVSLTNNLSIDATLNSGYGKTGLLHTNGNTLDGNNYLLNIANANGTWDCGIYTKGGIIKNLKISGAFRGIFSGGLTSDLLVENCEITAGAYPFNADGSNNYSVTFKNSILRGWTSYTSGFNQVYFDNCYFGSNGFYSYIRPYSKTQFKECIFEEGIELDATQTEEDLILENCKYGDTLITEDNVVTLLGQDAASAIIINN